MLLKIAISFLGAISFLYLLCCMILNTPIMGDGNVKELSKDIKCRWFWVMSIYIGKVIIVAIALTCIIGIPFTLFYY
jgi:hypothetical protein